MSRAWGAPARLFVVIIMCCAARITIVSAAKKYTMTFDFSEDNKDGTTTWTVSTATGSSREEPRRLSFTFSTDEYTQEKQTRELVAATKRRLKRRLACKPEDDVKRKKEARASETPEETAARQEDNVKRMREACASETPEETAARQEGNVKRMREA